MSFDISANNVSYLAASAIYNLFTEGYEYSSPKGPVKMASRCSLTLTSPQQRHLHIPGRKSNIFQLIAETLWVCSGSTRVTGFLEHFLPRAPLYADNGSDWRGAYGGRIFTPLTGVGTNNAVEDVIELLNKDPYSRQAHVPISATLSDLPTPLRVNEGIEQPKDVPCNVSLTFWVDPATNQLNMDVLQRSGDIFWGTGSINLFEFSFIHEYVWASLKHDGIGLGSYRQNVINLHYYPDNIGKQAATVCENFVNGAIPEEEDRDTGWMIPPNARGGIQPMCAKLIDYYEDMMLAAVAMVGVSSTGYPDFTIEDIFYMFDCPPIDTNSLYCYAKLVEAYLIGQAELKELVEDVNLLRHFPSLKLAVVNSKFYQK